MSRSHHYERHTRAVFNECIRHGSECVDIQEAANRLGGRGHDKRNRHRAGRKDRIRRANLRKFVLNHVEDSHE